MKTAKDQQEKVQVWLKDYYSLEFGHNSASIMEPVAFSL